MFSEILGLGAGVFQGIMGMKAANMQYQLGMEQLSLQRRALNDQTALAWQNQSMAEQEMRRLREQQKYQLETDAQNRFLLTDEYNTRLGSQKDRAQTAELERQAMIERQMKLDKDQAEKQVRAYTDYLRNKNLASEERAYAENMLQYAKSVAAGEADDDRRRYYEERYTAQQERQFGIEQLQRAQAIAASERNQDATIRNDLVGRAGMMSAAAGQALASLGPLDAPPPVTMDMITNAIDQRQALYMADADRAANIAASQNEASLIRAGLDASTVGQSKRADIADKSQQMFAHARQQGMDEALRYIMGQQQTLMEDYKGRMGFRERSVQEATTPYAVGSDILRQLPQMRSENDYRSPVDIGTGNFVRQLASANNYRAPVDLGTARYESNLGFMDGLGQTLNLPSAAAAQELNAGSRTLAPISWQITNPSSYMAAAQSGLANVSQSYGSLYGNMMNRGDSYMQGGMYSLGQAARSLGGIMDSSSFRNLFGSPVAAPASSGYGTGGYINGIPGYG